MKIGVVTVHDSSNFGSYLQAYAMKTALEGLGHEVYFIKTRDKKYLKRIFYKYPVSRKSVKHPIKVFKEYLAGRKKRKLFLEDVSLMNELEKWDDITLDKIVLGSDEIWNLNISAFSNEIFYGVGMNNVNAFAVSMGNANYKQYLKCPNLIEAIKNVNNIYVRDKNTQDIVEQITGDKKQIVCDPTFLVPVEKYTKKQIKDFGIKEDYILVYAYEVAINENIKHSIIRFAKENGLKVVSACFILDWCDYNINCSPLDFCSIIKDAKYVVTTTFHGTIFSVLNHKKFLCMPYSIKVNDVLSRVKLNSVIFDNNGSYEDFERILKNNDIDYDMVDRLILEQRNNGIEALKKCIS